VQLGQKDLQSLRLHVDTFANAEKISIDYALFEKSATVAVLPRQFAWSDVGNWASVHAALPHDADGNATGGDAALHESRDSLAFGEGVRVIALGVDDLVIIASADGVYVAPKNRAAEIKSLL
jgi:mannose-1-phosphate guanylyltransferase